MKTNVTVIPSDRIILVEGQSLRFDFSSPDTLHALQWHDGQGHMEFTDGTNQPLAVQDYQEKVQPFVTLWEEEKTRLDAEAGKQVAEAGTPVPQRVTPRQARLILFDTNLLDNVLSILDALPGREGERARLEWNSASEIDRVNPLFFLISAKLGLTEEDLDNLFIRTATL